MEERVILVTWGQQACLVHLVLLVNKEQMETVDQLGQEVLLAQLAHLVKTVLRVP